MSKWLASLLPILTVIATALAPQAQDAISHHPTVAIILAAAYSIMSHLLPSPVANK